MSMLFMVHFTFTKILTVVSAAPKLNQILHDTLVKDSQNTLEAVISDDSSSSDEYLSAETLRPNLRSQNISGFEGYVFDGKICKEINGRILCGYNTNKGENTQGAIVNLANGCRSRGDRIECGYLEGPFDISNRQKQLRIKSLSGEAESNKINASSYTTLEGISDKPTSQISNNNSTEINHIEDMESVISTSSTTTEANEIVSSSFFASAEFTTLINSIDVTTNENNNDTTNSSPRISKQVNAEGIKTFNVTKSSFPHDIPTSQSTDKSIHEEVQKDLSITRLQEMSSVYKTDVSTRYSNSNTHIKTTKKYTKRRNSDKDKIKTSCYEQNDRIVCYHYKLI